MRKLTSKQKKILDELYFKLDISSVEDIPEDIWELIESINDTEILYQECDRYLVDLRFRGKR